MKIDELPHIKITSKSTIIDILRSIDANNNKSNAVICSYLPFAMMIELHRLGFKTKLIPDSMGQYTISWS